MVFILTKGLVEIFSEIMERIPAMAKQRDPINRYPDIKVVETSGLK